MKPYRLLVPVLFAVLVAFCIVAHAQDQRVSKVVNFPKIVRAWNSIGPATKEWNTAMEEADRLLHERFNPNVVVVDPDAKRRETVSQLKVARDAGLKQIEALNELIEEEDY